MRVQMLRQRPGVENQSVQVVIPVKAVLTSVNVVKEAKEAVAVAIAAAVTGVEVVPAIAEAVAAIAEAVEVAQAVEHQGKNRIE